MVIIPQNGIGVVTKKFVLFGQHKILADGEIVALKGEAGLQADALAPGLHFWLWPWQYSIHIEPFIEIEEGLIGIVEAAGGKPISGGRVIGNAVACDSFQSVRDFIEKGGERGPQMAVIPPGKYRINTVFFTVMRERALEIEDNMVGVVTTKEGAPLPTGEIAGGEVPGHNMFQDGQLFCQAGGYKGPQEQVLLAGRYYVNPRFTTVQTYPMTEVPIANVGVVIAYVGSIGVDVTGDGFKHGNLVSPGEKGVCVTPLDPGRYPINPLTHKARSNACLPRTS